MYTNGATSIAFHEYRVHFSECSVIQEDIRDKRSIQINIHFQIERKRLSPCSSFGFEEHTYIYPGGYMYNLSESKYDFRPRRFVYWVLFARLC